MTFGKKVTEHKMCFDLLYNFYLKLDSGHSDVLLVLRQIKSTSNTSLFIKHTWKQSSKQAS